MPCSAALLSKYLRLCVCVFLFVLDWASGACKSTPLCGAQAATSPKVLTGWNFYFRGDGGIEHQTKGLLMLYGYIITPNGRKSRNFGENDYVMQKIKNCI